MTVSSPRTIPILYVHAGHKCLLRKINAVADFSFVTDLVKDRYTPDFGRPAEDPDPVSGYGTGFMLRLCLLQHLYGDSDRQVEENTNEKLLAS